MQTFKNTKVMSIVYRLVGLLLILSMASAGYGDEVSADEENAPVVPSNPKMTEKSASEKMGSPDATVSNDGSASYGYPILLPPGRGDADPSLVLSYNSNNRTTSGPLGVGFSLPVPAIERSTKRGLDYNGNDFVVGGQDLTPRSSDWGDGYYGARIESAFTKYHFSGNTWTATTRDGIKYYYGRESESRLEFPSGNTVNTFKWFLDKVEDTNGNYTEYEYQKDIWSNGHTREMNLKEIRYSGHDNPAKAPLFRVVFDYEEAGDLFTRSYKTHHATMQRQRLESILIYLTEPGQDDDLLRQYNLQYTEIEPNTVHTFDKPVLSFLDSIEAIEVDGSDTMPRSTTEFDWRDLWGLNWTGGMDPLNVGQEDTEIYGDLIPGLKVLTLDYNGDGKDDIFKFYMFSGMTYNQFVDFSEYMALFRAEGVNEDGDLHAGSYTEFCWGTNSGHNPDPSSGFTQEEYEPKCDSGNESVGIEEIRNHLGMKEDWEFIDVLAYDYDNDGKDDLLFWAGGKKDEHGNNHIDYPDRMWLFQSQGDDDQGRPRFILRNDGVSILDSRFWSKLVTLAKDNSYPHQAIASQHMGLMAIIPADFNSDGYPDLLVFNQYNYNMDFKYEKEDPNQTDPVLSLCADEPYIGRRINIFLSNGMVGDDSSLNDMYTEMYAGEDNNILESGIDSPLYELESWDRCYFRDEIQILDFNGDGYNDIVIGKRPRVDNKYAFCVYEYVEEDNAFSDGVGGRDGPICKIVDFAGEPGNVPSYDGDWESTNQHRHDAPVLTVIDYNGDGLTDILLASPTYNQTGGHALPEFPDLARGEHMLFRWNGNRQFVPVTDDIAALDEVYWNEGEEQGLYTITPIDFNHDGNMDLFFNGHRIALSLGNGKFMRVSPELIPSTSSLSIGGTRGSKVVFQPIDIMGSGVPQIMWQKNFFYFKYTSVLPLTPVKSYKHKMFRGGFRQVPYLLTDITTKHGYLEDNVPAALYHKKVTIAYRPSSEMPNNEMTKSIYQVVDTITVDYGTDTNIGPFETKYEFSEGYFDSINREFRGFKIVTKTNPDRSIEIMKYLTLKYIFQGKKYEHFYISPFGHGACTVDDYLHCPRRRVFYQWSSSELPSPNDAPSKFIYVSEKIEETYDNFENIKDSSWEERYEYNAACGLLETTESNKLNSADINRTTTTYENLGAPNGWLWRPRSEYVYGSEYGITVDGYNYVARATFYDEYDGDGNLTLQKNLIGLDAGNKITAEHEYEYDDFGNVDKQWDPKDNLTEYEYETVLNKYVSKITMPKTQNIENGAERTEHVVEYLKYNYKYGVPGEYKDENDKVTEYSYDALGRKKEVHYPNYDPGEITEYIYEDRTFPRYTDEKVHVGTGQTTIDTRTYIDGDDRPLQIVTRTAEDPENPGVTRYTSRISLYDSMGRNDWNYGPYHCSNQHFFTSLDYETVCPYQNRWQRNDYDHLGRTKLITMPYDLEDSGGVTDEITTIYVYEGWDTTIIDPDDKYKRITEDHLGRTVSVYEFIDAFEKETAYQYNAAGDLREIWLMDPERSVTWLIKFFYDSLGRKTETHDPNMGTWFYEYDDNGNMTELEDAKDNIITFVYDELNRLQKKTSMTADTTVEDEVINIYDNPDDTKNGKGRLYISKNNKDSDGNYGVEIMIDDYDEMGNVLSEIITIKDTDADKVYTTKITYDKSGKPIVMKKGT
ncbi:MAG: FG-GAP-like repeat-containing protein [Myxococcota bacterium]|nr:FG-GAP-like repeat-containing protein [Myxococcota bacterium]